MTSNDVNQVVLVSGGSRGLGAALVQGLLDDGYTVCTFSRSRSEQIDAWESDLGERFWYQSCDTANGTAIREFVRDVHQRYQRIDGLVNNAAVARDGIFAVMSDRDIEMMLDVNLKGCMLLTREVVRCMLLRRSGSIVNISSIVGSTGFSGLAGYSVTKAGLFGLTRSLARELGGRDIRVNCVAPGYLETEMSEALSDQQRCQIERRTPLGRLGTPEDVIPVISFLLSPASRFITGQIITVDGGATA